MPQLTRETSTARFLALASLVLLFSGCQESETPPTPEVEKIESQATFGEASILEAPSNSTPEPENESMSQEEQTQESEASAPFFSGEEPGTWEEGSFLREDIVWEEDISSECDWDYSWYAADQFVTFSDPNLGIEFDFQTKEAWWDEGHGEVPYGVIPGGAEFRLRFGPLGSLDGCDLPQYYLMAIAPRRSTDAILKALEKETWSDPVPTPYTLNGNEAVLYESSGLCEHPQLEIVGPTANYLFYPICGNENEIKVLLKLGEGVKWL